MNIFEKMEWNIFNSNIKENKKKGYSWEEKNSKSNRLYNRRPKS
jgi:hypothetical protein